MARNRISLKINMEDMITSLERAGKDVNKSVDNVLKASKSIVNQKLIADTKKANFPARGKYSTGQLANSIDKDFNVKWAGYTAELKIGYDFSKSGLTSIMILYGTPRMNKVQKLYDDIYGRKVNAEIKKIQQEALNKILERAVSS